MYCPKWYLLQYFEWFSFAEASELCHKLNSVYDEGYKELVHKLRLYAFKLWKSSKRDIWGIGRLKDEPNRSFHTRTYRTKLLAKIDNQPPS